MVRTKGIPTKKTPSGSGDPLAVVNSVGADGAAAVVTGKKPRKPYRAKSGKKALREIRHLQKTTELVIPKLPFQRLVREITQSAHSGDLRFTRNAIGTLQEAAEAYITEMFGASLLSAVSNRRVTVMQKDLKLAQKLRGPITFV
jgi:histone H3